MISYEKHHKLLQNTRYFKSNSTKLGHSTHNRIEITNCKIISREINFYTWHSFRRINRYIHTKATKRL